MLKEWNRTFLTLLPKVEHPELVSQYRTISLCNVLYKCIAKCLTGRLRLVLSFLVSDHQNAFVPSRLMSDNGLITHELLSFMNASKARKRFYAALKLDMNKAYDRVRWDFLFRVLKKFGFPSYWIHIIRQCVTSVSYQVLVNGSPSASFLPQCGLRQGDPLSPYLFVLCMEVLSALLVWAEEHSLIQGLRISRGAPSITHLFFADESLLFFQVSPPSCDHLMDILKEFCELSGQIVNLQKSFDKFSPNTPQDYKEYLAQCLKLQHKPSLSSYLGLPVDLGRGKVSQFSYLIDKISNRLLDFASLHLFVATKLVIINYVMIASFNHVLSVFKIPASICAWIDQMLARFWWRSSSTSRGLALRSAFLLHLPKGLGGLGVRSLGCFDSAIGQDPSSFLGMSELDGVQVRLTKDSWVPGSSSIQTRLWNDPQELMDDFVYWKFTRDDAFSTKSAYALLIRQLSASIASASVPPNWWKRFWGLPILPKFKMLGWKLLHNALPLCSVLRDRGLLVNSMRVFCNQHGTISHLFCDCSFSAHLLVCGPMGFDRHLLSAKPSDIWFANLVSGFTASSNWEGLTTLFSLLWAVWLTRNHIIFNQATCSPASVLQLAAAWVDRDFRSRAVNLRRPIPLISPSLQIACLRGDPSDDLDVCLMFDGAWLAVDNCVLVLACLGGLHMAFRRGVRRLLICTYCGVLISLVSHVRSADVAYVWLLRDISSALLKFTAC
ncbi:uncharacterized protein LOC110737563 [Chenopodium quinoa]|uniref:uncharacterized protein LOC110737563 n=1 Tax=Chenopodium quinoa TaxID=63459 RepID=UPI000B793C1F|nr:uncharacterized protein LOC110737563 [Chenopodium quinoa]